MTTRRVPVSQRLERIGRGGAGADPLLATPGAPMSDLRGRISRLLLLRTLVVSVVLGLSLWLLTTGEAPAAAAMWLQSSIIAATYLTSIAFGVLLRRGVAPTRIARPQLASDIVVTSLLVYVTGGAQSPYTFLYALSIVGAGALLYRRGAVVVTIASIVALSTVALLAWARAIDLPVSAQVVPWEQTSHELVRTLGINLAALVGVGALAFLLGDQLQRGAETLATTRRAAADLLTLHQDILRSLSSGLITTTPDGTILTANQAAIEILRANPATATGQPLDALMPGLSALIATQPEGALRRADLALAAPRDDDDGDATDHAHAPMLTVGVTVSPLRDLRDEVIGRVVNFQDLTELRRLEEHIHRAERLAMIGQLAAGIAHEIRNPLAAISGSIELLRQAPQASEDDRSLMTIVTREIQRLNLLIGDLLDYANPRPRQPVELDLGVMVEETLQVARADHAFAAVELTGEIAKPVRVTADAGKLGQVLWNLLRNAADAAAEGGGHVRVAVRADAEASDDSDGRALLIVEDDGPGIPADQLARIFDPFFTTKRHGTGLGLATSHAVIAEHGGRIDVETTVGTGTRMIVRLPRVMTGASGAALAISG